MTVFHTKGSGFSDLLGTSLVVNALNHSLNVLELCKMLANKVCSTMQNLEQLCTCSCLPTLKLCHDLY